MRQQYADNNGSQKAIKCVYSAHTDTGFPVHTLYRIAIAISIVRVEHTRYEAIHTDNTRTQ